MSEAEATSASAAAAVAEAPPRLAANEALDAWDQAIRQSALLLRATAPDAAWLTQLRSNAERVRALAARDADKAIYLLLQAASSDLDRYSAHHAMLCAVVGQACAGAMQWPADEIDALFNAALTMNLSMSAAQDTLVRQAGPLSASQRELVAQHAARSAELLAIAGVDDSRWLDTVRAHHDASADAAPERRAAQLLMRVDVYTAKLSRRATREPVSAALAARDACLDVQCKPDAIGSAILRTMGLYPPGSFVQLASGEVGVVVRRGAKAHTPLVAVLRRGDGSLHQQPLLRDAGLARHAIARGVTLADVKVHVNHARVLAL
jgi:hypothetical protein